MKLRTHAALLWAMLCLPFMLGAQTLFRQQCRGEGENNLANFTITNSLPTGLEDCELTNCNPYFLAALKVEGSCVEHQWAFQDVPDPTRRGFEFCKPFELQQVHKVNHIVTISDDVPARVYTATCTFTPVQCCDLNFSVTLLQKEVLGEIDNRQTCLVRVEEHFDAGQVTDYSVETLEEVIYRGTQPQGEYRVPCGSQGDVICFTAKNTEADCEQSKCFFLENLDAGSIVMPRIQANTNQQTLTMACFPNPASDALTVNLFVPEGGEGNLQMMNIYGAVLFESNIASGHITKEIDTNAFASGTYLIAVRNGSQITAAQKVVLMKK